SEQARGRRHRLATADRRESGDNDAGGGGLRAHAREGRLDTREAVAQRSPSAREPLLYDVVADVQTLGDPPDGLAFKIEEDECLAMRLGQASERPLKQLSIFAIERFVFWCAHGLHILVPTIRLLVPTRAATHGNAR